MMESPPNLVESKRLAALRSLNKLDTPLEERFERITRLARVVGRENIIAGTDCGFAQGPFHRRVHPSIMWAKLESLAQGARLATNELWG